MFKLYKSRETLNKADACSLFYLCFGEWPLSEHEVSDAIDQKPVDILTVWTDTFDFRHKRMGRFIQGYYPQFEYITPIQLKSIAKTLKHFFHLRVPKFLSSQEWARLADQLYRHPIYFEALSNNYNRKKLKNFLSALNELSLRDTLTLVGHFRIVQGMICRGFALDSRKINQPLTLNFYAGSAFIGSTIADKIHRGAQEQYKSKGYHGFEFRTHVPAHLQTADSIMIHITEATTGIEIDQPREISQGKTRELMFHQRLLRTVSDFRDKLTSPDAQALLTAEQLSVFSNALDKLKGSAPSLERYAAFPLSNYHLFKNTYKTPPPPSMPHKNTKFHIILEGQENQENLITPTDSGSLKKQSYPNWQAHLTLSNAINVADQEDIIIHLSPNDRLHKHALAWFAWGFQQHPAAKLIYSDHDYNHTNHHIDPLPCFKATFDYIMYLQQNYIGCTYGIKAGEVSDGQFKPSEHIFSVFEKYGKTGFAQISETLWHQELSQTKKNDAAGHHKAAVQNHLMRTGQSDWIKLDQNIDPSTAALAKQPAEITHVKFYPPTDAPKLAIIIPTRNSLDMIKPCVESLQKTLSNRFTTEIIIIDNQSDDPKTHKWFKKVASDTVKILQYDHEFNWSAINNYAVENTDADYLLFLNNDTVVISQDWEERLRGLLALKETGCIGARLLYEDGTIQHAGVVLYHHGVASHEAVGDTCDHGLYHYRTQLTHASAAVTGAFLACRRTVFDEIKGFESEHLKVTFNDIDFCLKAAKAGYTNLYSPDITLYHLESKSRGFDNQNPEKANRAALERQWMENQWHGHLNSDPFYPKRFSRFGKPFSLMVP